MFDWLNTSRGTASRSEEVGLTSAFGQATSRLSSVSRLSRSSDESNAYPHRLLKHFNLSPGSADSEEHAKHIVQLLGAHEEEREKEDDQAQDLHKEKVSLEEDSYGLLIMRILYWSDGTDSAVFWTRHGIDYEGSCRSQPWLALVHANIVFILTVVTQLWVTWMLYRNSKNLMQHWETFPDRHNQMTINQAATEVSQMVASGNLDPQLLAECQKTWSIRDNAVFVFILILWTAKMVPEFKMAKKSVRELLAIDSRNGKEPMLASDGCTVLRISHCLRAFLILSIPTVRLVVAICLFVAGCDFICSQEQTGSVVLKGMCMWFVTDIDTIFLKAFASEGAQRKLQSLRLMVAKEKNIFINMTPRLWDHGLGGLIYLMFVVLCVGYQTGILGYACEVPGLDHTKAQLFNFRVTCNHYCSQVASPDSPPRCGAMPL
eukprot:TRINITY_DN24023_c0_g1_i2.p1 TRINITY_DN24023_c0_g1~~TRINITY_DN24023_c0_g1_i2.p1  ORF type:complete len:432 (+),score=61.19 TRINITY_DN24023_c0_g1_i2:54-1349(+)